MFSIIQQFVRTHYDVYSIIRVKSNKFQTIANLRLIYASTVSTLLYQVSFLA